MAKARLSWERETSPTPAATRRLPLPLLEGAAGGRPWRRVVQTMTKATRAGVGSGTRAGSEGSDTGARAAPRADAGAGAMSNYVVGWTFTSMVFCFLSPSFGRLMVNMPLSKVAVAASTLTFGGSRTVRKYELVVYSFR